MILRQLYISGAAILAVYGLLVPAQAGPNCTCRYAGENYKIGEIMCIRGRLSRCEMQLNNTSWRMLEKTCPQAHLMTPAGKDMTYAMAVLGGQRAR